MSTDAKGPSKVMEAQGGGSTGPTVFEGSLDSKSSKLDSNNRHVGLQPAHEEEVAAFVS